MKKGSNPGPPAGVKLPAAPPAPPGCNKGEVILWKYAGDYDSMKPDDVVLVWRDDDGSIKATTLAEFKAMIGHISERYTP